MAYYLPGLAACLPESLSTNLPNLGPRSNAYVMGMRNHLDAEEHTLLRRLHERASEIPWTEAAAECKDHLQAGIETTGKRIELDGIDHFTVRGGTIVSNFVVFDQMDVGRQLGLLPPDGSSPDRALKAAFNAKTKIAEAIRERRG